LARSGVFETPRRQDAKALVRFGFEAVRIDRGFAARGGRWGLGRNAVTSKNDSDPSHGDFAVKGVVQLIMDIVLWSWIEGSEPVV
jgi:hypothetical protein